jgi:D-3-phosphoglycerate dehydrogenase
MDMIPEGEMVMIQNKDQPGVIGTVGSSFGNAGINIADMVISRDFQPDGSALALMVLKTDSQAPESLLGELRKKPGIVRVKSMRVMARR